MERQAIVQLLRDNYQDFVGYMQSLSDADFSYAPPGEWCAGQQLDHLVRTVSRVLVAVKQPIFILKLFFGKPRRPKMDYQQVVGAYKKELEQGGPTAKRYLPDGKKFLAHREVQIADLTRLVNELADRVMAITEEDLDQTRLPHPRLGKLSLREMMYFTAYHFVNHREGIEANLLKQNTY